MKKLYILIALVVLSGCGTIPISDDQIETISSHVAQAAEQGAKLARPFLEQWVPGITDLLAVIIGLSTGAGTRWTLRQLQQKKKDEMKQAVKEAGNA